METKRRDIVVVMEVDMEEEEVEDNLSNKKYIIVSR